MPNAPLDESFYFTTDERLNLSPGVANVSEDWVGTNVGGSENTWRIVATAHASSATMFQPTSLTITGESSFNYELTTTEAFVEPLKAPGALFVPGAAALFSCDFTIDEQASFSLHTELRDVSIVRISKIGGGSVFSQSSSGPLLKVIDTGGMLLPGAYQISANANNAGPSGLDDGVNLISRLGLVSNFQFSVQVPEPSGFFTLTLVALAHRWPINRD